MVSYHSIKYSHVGEDKWRFLSYSLYFAELNSVQIRCIRVWDRSFKTGNRSIQIADRSIRIFDRSVGTRSSFADRENYTRSIKRLSVFLFVLHIDQDRPMDRPFNIQIDRSTLSGHHSLFKGLIESDLLTKLIRHEN